ncbi:hypothetical protein CI610_02619 [invertebrate metagenome]|uniref:Uncharacterized protein n=1 Tax=invertebrate metagenome TaxID=1711999 RepID=A0A2H9T5E7_9ZZZZ
MTIFIYAIAVLSFEVSAVLSKKESSCYTQNQNHMLVSFQMIDQDTFHNIRVEKQGNTCNNKAVHSNPWDSMQLTLEDFPSLLEVQSNISGKHKKTVDLSKQLPSAPHLKPKYAPLDGLLFPKLQSIHEMPLKKEKTPEEKKLGLIRNFIEQAIHAINDTNIATYGHLMDAMNEKKLSLETKNFLRKIADEWITLTKKQINIILRLDYEPLMIFIKKAGQSFSIKQDMHDYFLGSIHSGSVLALIQKIDAEEERVLIQGIAKYAAAPKKTLLSFMESETPYPLPPSILLQQTRHEQEDNGIHYSTCPSGIVTFDQLNENTLEKRTAPSRARGSMDVVPDHIQSSGLPVAAITPFNVPSVEVKSVVPAIIAVDRRMLKGNPCMEVQKGGIIRHGKDKIRSDKFRSAGMFPNLLDGNEPEKTRRVRKTIDITSILEHLSSSPIPVAIVKSLKFSHSNVADDADITIPSPIPKDWGEPLPEGYWKKKKRKKRYLTGPETTQYITSVTDIIIPSPVPKDWGEPLPEDYRQKKKRKKRYLTEAEILRSMDRQEITNANLSNTLIQTSVKKDTKVSQVLTTSPKNRSQQKKFNITPILEHLSGSPIELTKPIRSHKKNTIGHTLSVTVSNLSCSSQEKRKKEVLTEEDAFMPFQSFAKKDIKASQVLVNSSKNVSQQKRFNINPILEHLSGSPIELTKPIRSYEKNTIGYTPAVTASDIICSLQGKRKKDALVEEEIFQSTKKQKRKHHLKERNLNMADTASDEDTSEAISLERDGVFFAPLNNVNETSNIDKMHFASQKNLNADSAGELDKREKTTPTNRMLMVKKSAKAEKMENNKTGIVDNKTNNDRLSDLTGCSVENYVNDLTFGDFTDDEKREFFRSKNKLREKNLNKGKPESSTTSKYKNRKPIIKKPKNTCNYFSQEEANQNKKTVIECRDMPSLPQDLSSQKSSTSGALTTSADKNHSGAECPMPDKTTQEPNVRDEKMPDDKDVYQYSKAEVSPELADSYHRGRMKDIEPDNETTDANSTCKDLPVEGLSVSSNEKIADNEKRDADILFHDQENISESASKQSEQQQDEETDTISTDKDISAHKKKKKQGKKHKKKESKILEKTFDELIEEAKQYNQNEGRKTVKTKLSEMVSLPEPGKACTVTKDKGKENIRNTEQILTPYTLKGENSDIWLLIDKVLQEHSSGWLWEKIQVLYESADTTTILSKEMTLLLIRAAKHSHDALHQLTKAIAYGRIDLNGNEWPLLIILYRAYKKGCLGTKHSASFQYVSLSDLEKERLSTIKTNGKCSLKAMNFLIANTLIALLKGIYLDDQSERELAAQIDNILHLLDSNQLCQQSRTARKKGKQLLQFFRELIAFEFDQSVEQEDSLPLMAWLHLMTEGFGKTDSEKKRDIFCQRFDAAKQHIPYVGLLSALFYMSLLSENVGVFQYAAKQDEWNCCQRDLKIAMLLNDDYNLTQRERLLLKNNKVDPICCAISESIFANLLLYREIFMQDSEIINVLSAAMAYSPVASLFGIVIAKNTQKIEKYLCKVCCGYGVLFQCYCGLRICEFCKQKLAQVTMVYCTDEAHSEPVWLSEHSSQGLFPDRSVMREISRLYSGYQWIYWQPLRTGVK